ATAIGAGAGPGGAGDRQIHPGRRLLHASVLRQQGLHCPVFLSAAARGPDLHLVADAVCLPDSASGLSSWQLHGPLVKAGNNTIRGKQIVESYMWEADPGALIAIALMVLLYAG